MRVFLDACVLYPPLVRAILLGAAGHGLFVPLWSERVLEEWRRAVAAKQGGEAEHLVHEAKDNMTRVFPTACQDGDPELEAQIHLPDPADVHVLAAAVGSGADVLLTFNLRDFPHHVLAGQGIAPRHPDGFLWELLGAREEVMPGVVDAALADAGIERGRGRSALKRARLPRLAKAWEAARA